MRLDFFVAHARGLTRKQARVCIGTGRVRVNGAVQKKSAAAVTDADAVTLDGDTLALPGHRYLMLHKPQGVVCSTDDPDHPTVLSLLPAQDRDGLHPAGRLDRDTTGLVLLTSDGDWSHRITAPASHLPKTYRVTLDAPLSDAQRAQLEAGVMLRNETRATRPAQVVPVDATCIRLTISEGRYHQVKRMLAAVGNRVTALHREAIGALVLDKALAPGEWRHLQAAERDQLAGVSA